MIRISFCIAAICGAAASAKTIDVLPLWDFDRPAVSEERFRAALNTAVGDDVLILQTQIARTYVFRKDFARAREILQGIQPKVEGAGPEAQIRYWLELGRTYVSHQHPLELQTAEAKQLARTAFDKALQLARRAHLDGLAIDAIHMFAFVDTAPADQLKRGLEALAIAQTSDQAPAKRWEASVRNNLGEALFELGRYDEALEQFKRALAIYEQGSNVRWIRDAHWQVGRVLRVLKRTDEALAIQLRLERESAGVPETYVFEELELLYRAQGNEERAKHYAERN